MNEKEKQEVREAVEAANIAFEHLENAKSYLDSASRWGIVDIVTAGSLISGISKHRKMSKAEQEMEEAKLALDRFSQKLKDVQGFAPIHVGDFLKFADIFFDGLLVDVLTQSKIDKAKEQCVFALLQVDEIRYKLLTYSSRKSNYGGETTGK